LFINIYKKKKLIFSVLAYVAFPGSSFASNEIAEELKTHFILKNVSIFINMKKKLILIFIAFYFKAYSQTTYNVEYNQIFNTDFPVIRTAILQVDENKSIFNDIMKSRRDFKKKDDAEESYLDFIKNDKEEIEKGEKVVFSFGANYDNYYYVNDLKNKTFTFNGELSKKLYIISDEFQLNWKITDETKIVSGKKTYKAETFFRGRKWIAWFCPDLPYPYGPWKLYGLPGLILEAYDESKRYHFVALKIFESNDRLNAKCDKCTEIDMKFFVKRKFSSNENILYIPDRDLKVISYDIKNKDRELKYEWEE